MVYRLQHYLFFLLILSSAAIANSFDEAVGAYDRKDFEAAFQSFKEQADSGNAAAMFKLGMMHIQGKGTPVDADAGTRLIMQAADRNNTDALTFLASAIGESHPKDAYEYWKRAAYLGDAQAQLNIGTYLRLGETWITQDKFEAIEWYRKSAAQNNLMAMLDLGDMYQKGDGVEINYNEAFKWFTKAAEQGEPEAQLRIASMYLEGQGVPQDYQETIKWVRKAADQGYSYAQIRLGALYFQGRAVSRNLVQSHKWINLGISRLPDSDAKTREKGKELLSLIEAQMKPTEVSMAQKLAREWRPDTQVKNIPSPSARPAHSDKSSSPKPGSSQKN